MNRRKTDGIYGRLLWGGLIVQLFLFVLNVVAATLFLRVTSKYSEGAEEVVRAGKRANAFMDAIERDREAKNPSWGRSL